MLGFDRTSEYGDESRIWYVAASTVGKTRERDPDLHSSMIYIHSYIYHIRIWNYDICAPTSAAEVMIVTQLT